MKRALVVDDESLLRRQVAEIVAGYGFDEVLEAENGVQAIEIVTHQDVLLVVMDVGMPVMDGVSAAEKIGKIKPVPIVLVTANSRNRYQRLVWLASTMDNVGKPVRAEPVRRRGSGYSPVHRTVQPARRGRQASRLLAARKVIDRAREFSMKRELHEAGSFPTAAETGNG